MGDDSDFTVEWQCPECDYSVSGPLLEKARVIDESFNHMKEAHN